MIGYLNCHILQCSPQAVMVYRADTSSSERISDDTLLNDGISTVYLRMEGISIVMGLSRTLRVYWIDTPTILKGFGRFSFESKGYLLK